MKKVLKTILFVSLFVSNAISANYKYVDVGDYYHIYEATSDNQYVVVVRKMGNNQIKVRNLNTMTTDVVSASQLLTKAELDEVSISMGVGATAFGVGIVYCLLNPEGCK